MPLSPEQCALVEKNHQLVYGFLQGRHLSIDRYEGACDEGLCKAAMTFNPAKGSFSSWAYMYMLSQARMEMRSERRQIPTEALEPWMNTGSAGCFHDGPDIHSIVEDVAAQLKPRDRKVLQLLLAGRRQTAIAAEIGCAQTQVSRIKKHISQILKEMMAE